MFKVIVKDTRKEEQYSEMFVDTFAEAKSMLQEVVNELSGNQGEFEFGKHWLGAKHVDWMVFEGDEGDYWVEVKISN